MSGWIIGFIEQYGYLGVAALMMLENVFPPIPSELIMPFAGYVGARGTLSPWGVLFAGVAGSIAGTLPWYWLGRRVGRERVLRLVARYGRWLTVSTDDLLRAEQWFQRWGVHSVLLGRLVPAVRSVISLPAGIEAMPLPTFLFWSTLGTAAWTALLLGLGFVLEDNYEQVARFVDPISTTVVVGCVVVYVWRLVRGRGKPA
ncbi:MAG: DedA family protein [Variovorax sp.]|nr:MAG: DedA family protein [Variovorax sp.]